jgi:hypothetical protein
VRASLMCTIRKKKKRELPGKTRSAGLVRDGVFVFANLEERDLFGWLGIDQ